MQVLLLVLLALVVAPGQSAQGPPACEKPRDACALFDQFLSALNERDWNAFRATFDDQIAVIFDRPGPPERRNGRVAVEELFRRIFPPGGERPIQLPPAIRPYDLLAQDLDDTVVVSFHIRGADEIARRTVVLHRTAGGWRVVHIHASSSDVAVAGLAGCCST